MSPALAWPHELIDLPAWEALGEDETHRVECVEGVLVVTPRPVARHQVTILGLAGALAAALPERLRALPEFELLLDLDRVSAL